MLADGLADRGEVEEADVKQCFTDIKSSLEKVAPDVKLPEGTTDLKSLPLPKDVAWAWAQADGQWPLADYTLFSVEGWLQPG